ncbi:DUF250 domain-containing protein [Histoplasma capsulatum]|uniref:DUF250 domain-containing protein n=1 Tax=Ajellomyces capsulatus TaxID=5037 RepID=A0A8A1MB78_AJECA|nr:DUF250 domain-containing protein [Histoplasma capsulatum]
MTPSLLISRYTTHSLPDGCRGNKLLSLPWVLNSAREKVSVKPSTALEIVAQASVSMPRSSRRP